MLADKIRSLVRQKYVLPARSRKVKRFSVRAGDVESELGLVGRTPAVCSALKTKRFLEQNQLRLVNTSGPPSGQSSTVTYTYEFSEAGPASVSKKEDAWKKLRGALKDVFAELGGGEAYLRAERRAFNGSRENR
jgi:hypothetical protein